MMIEEQPEFVPHWPREAVFYQIFPERFANGDPSNDPPGVEPWGAQPKVNNYFGGDLRGIIDHLDYIAGLGATAIYLNPVFASASNHKYYTSDYLKIDPAFGTNELFREFVAAGHGKGIRLVIDGVFNHTGTDHWAFQDIVKNGEKSKYLGWYNIYSLPVVVLQTNPNYEAWWGYGRLPKLMVENPEVKSHLFEVTKYWTEMGIDGWRLDVPNELPHEFWIEWRSLVKEINPECYIVGEIWDDASDWLKGDQFDAVMNYEFRKACLDFFCQGSSLPTEFNARLAATRSHYPAEVSYVLQNLLGSHDTERFLTLCNREIWRAKLAVLFQMTYVGAPMVYYGDEIGMEGGKDPDCRRTMIWDETRWNTDLLEYFQKLMKFRAKSNALRHGEFTTLVADDARNILIFSRQLEAENVYVILNLGSEAQSVSFPVASNLQEPEEILFHARLQVGGGTMLCRVPARSGYLIVSHS